MDIFEYIRTSFHVVKAFVTQDKLIFIGLGVLGLFIIWSIFSLLFSHEHRMMRVWRRMEKSLRPATISPEVYFSFTRYFKKLPAASSRNWRKYEVQKTGKPSDYLSQEDMLDSPLSGGVHKQNRSIMKFAIGTVTFFCFLLSLASLGGAETLTAGVVCEAMLVPFLLFLLYRINYYVYTAIRHYSYRMAVDNFQDFVDYLDAKISVSEIFEGQENLLAVSSNCYVSGVECTKKKKEREQIQTLEMVEPEMPSEPLREEVVQPEQKQEDDVLTKAFYRNRSGGLEIRSQQEFTDALAVVEKLLDKTANVPYSADEKTKRVAELMDAMNKYRNKKMQ